MQDCPWILNPLTGHECDLSNPDVKVLPLNPTDLYLNKELSWLEFNGRVLEEALTDETPLLEKLKFLSIFTSNLDEFFMVRVAGLKKIEQEALRIFDSPDALEPAVVQDKIRQRTVELVNEQYKCLKEIVLPGLAAHDIKIVKIAELTPAQKQVIDDYFETDVSPVLTPLGFDPAHPFPFLSNHSVYLAVIAKDLTSGEVDVPGIGFVEVPSIIPRLISVKSEIPNQIRYVLLEDLIANNLSSLFLGLHVEAAFTLRVTRNLDYNLLENKVVDLLKSIQKEMTSREHQEVVRVEVDTDLPEPIRAMLKARLQIADNELYVTPSPLFIPGLMALYGSPREGLKDPPFNPRLPPTLVTNEDMFSVIARKDLLVHHPYESFYAVTEFLHLAARDPQVLAIKQTLYRSSGDSPIIESLITAAETGKQVTAVIELKARFDEKNNIIWARRLERAGVNVVFGFVGIKTHCKATLVVRREKTKLVRYVHLSTGNYNSTTARLYTDIGLFTTDDAIGRDVAMIFNLISGFDVLTGSNRSKDQAILSRLHRLALAPINLRSTILKLIDQEIDQQKRHGTGFIMAKMNGLVDKDIIDALYKASQAGVRIQLIVRGICCLKPGIPGLSQNIEVISIVDRFLEHSRIYYFHAGGEHKVYLASADWMSRNMDRRIEIAFPIGDKDVKARLLNEILLTTWADNVKARVLQPDGKYLKRKVAAGQPKIRSQARFIEIAREGGIQSIPYDIAIRHNPGRKHGQRPIARKKPKKDKSGEAQAAPQPALASTLKPSDDPKT